MKKNYLLSFIAIVLLITSTGCEDTKTRERPEKSRSAQGDVYAQAIAHYDKGEYEKAIELFTEAAKDSDDPALYCNRASCYSYLNQFEAAINDYDTAINKAIELSNMEKLREAVKDNVSKNKTIKLSNEPDDPRLAALYYNRGYANQRAKKYRQAISDYEKTISLNKDYPDVKNQFAWILATNPDKEIRNPRQAVELAKDECERTEWKSGYCIDTLAAAYAAFGDFANAIKMQEKAIKLIEITEIKEKCSKRLELYRNKKPFLDTEE